jgi:hypothetical protein
MADRLDRIACHWLSRSPVHVSFSIAHARVSSAKVDESLQMKAKHFVASSSRSKVRYAGGKFV